MSSKITDFLKKSKKDFIADKINRECETERVDEFSQLKDELNIYKSRAKIAEKNLAIAKKLLRSSNDLNVQKDLKIQQLLEQNANLNAHSTGICEQLFAEYSGRFDAEELKTIRSTGPGVANDSRFILHLMRFLYKGDEFGKLKNRSATGRKWKGAKKQEISFEKKEVMKKMLQERIKGELKSQSGGMDELSQRIGRFNDLVKNAIQNIISKPRKRPHSEIGVEGQPNSGIHKSTTSDQVGIAI